MQQNIAYSRFYEELNDFLPASCRKKQVIYCFNGNPAIKDSIEALGVPHTEVDLILVHGESVRTKVKGEYISMVLQGKVAIITGASRGIGRAAARAFATAGAAVVLVARSQPSLHELAAEIEEDGGRAEAVAMDVGETHAVDTLAQRTIARFGRIDILVNNAALLQPLGMLWETDPATWQRALLTNVFGAYLCARAVLPQMLRQRSGRIINVSSGVAVLDLEGSSAYNASKAALERLSGTLAAEVGDSGITVSVLRPGMVDTSMQAEIRGTAPARFPRVQRWLDAHARGALLNPGKPAEALLWLASDHAAGTNGDIFEMNDKTFQRRIEADLRS